MAANGTDNHTSNGTLLNGCVTSAESSFNQISWVIAISLAILAAISNNLGVNFQKLAWTQKQRNEKRSKYRLMWGIGMAGIILASVFDFVALAFGPQSVIAPLGSLTMVLNGCIAPFMHGEKLRRKIIWTTCIIVIGCIMAVATASHDNVICSVDGIFGYFDSVTFLGYALVIIFLAGGAITFIRRAEKVLKVYGVDSEKYERIFKFHRVSYAFLAGLFGAQSVVFARALGQLAVSSTYGGVIFLARWQTYLLLIALISMIVIQMIYLNKGLSRFESSYNVPVFTGTFIVGTAVSGGVVYGEFSAFSQLQAVLFPLGVSLCVLGVFALAWGNDDDDIIDINDHDMSLGTIPSPSGALPDHPPARHSSLRLRSGGFTPFIFETEDVPKHIQPHRSDLHHALPRTHFQRDLLTGLGPEEIAALIALTSPSSVHRMEHGTFSMAKLNPTPSNSALNNSHTTTSPSRNSELDMRHFALPSAATTAATTSKNGRDFDASLVNLDDLIHARPKQNSSLSPLTTSTTVSVQSSPAGLNGREFDDVNLDELRRPLSPSKKNGFHVDDI